MAASIKKRFSLKGNKVSDAGSATQESTVTLRPRRSQEDRHQVTSYPEIDILVEPQ